MPSQIGGLTIQDHRWLQETPRLVASEQMGCDCLGKYCKARIQVRTYISFYSER